MPTVLHLLPDLGLNGAAKQVALLAPTLVGFGYAAHVAVLGGGGVFAESLARVNIPVSYLGGSARFDLTQFVFFHRLVADLKPNLIHAWRWPALRLAGLNGLWPSLRGRHLPVIASDVLTADSEIGRSNRFLVRRAARVVVATAEELARARKWGIDRARLSEIPLVVSCDPAPPDRAELVRELRLPESARIVVCAGMMGPKKGFLEAAWLFDILQHIDPDVWLLVIGDGPERGRMEAFVRGMGPAGGRVRFAGVRRDVPRLLGLAEVVWVTGRCGGRNVALEALATGRPVVATLRPDMRALLGDDGAALMIPANDRQGFVTATRRVLDDPNVRRRMEAAARRRAALFALPEVAARWADLYRL